MARETREELFVCAVRGHFLPGASIDPLEAQHHVVARPTADGRRLAQCLRCGSWVLVPEPEPGAGKPLATVAEIEKPRRGKALRQALVLRVIAVDRAVHTIAFGATAVAALAIRWNLDAVHGWASSLLGSLASAKSGSGGMNAHGLTAGLLTRLAHLRPHSLLLLALIASAYAIVSAFETIGLWRERRWAEYLTALATAGFLPIELYELVERITVVRIGTMVVNLAVLAYLVVAKHLFGIGGPPAEPKPVPVEALPDLAANAG